MILPAPAPEARAQPEPVVARYDTVSAYAPGLFVNIGSLGASIGRTTGLKFAFPSISWSTPGLVLTVGSCEWLLDDGERFDIQRFDATWLGYVLPVGAMLPLHADERFTAGIFSDLAFWSPFSVSGHKTRDEIRSRFNLPPGYAVDYGDEIRPPMGRVGVRYTGGLELGKDGNALGITASLGYRHQFGSWERAVTVREPSLQVVRNLKAEMGSFEGPFLELNLGWAFFQGNRRYARTVEVERFPSPILEIHTPYEGTIFALRAGTTDTLDFTVVNRGRYPAEELTFSVRTDAVDNYGIRITAPSFLGDVSSNNQKASRVALAVPRGIARRDTIGLTLVCSDVRGFSARHTVRVTVVPFAETTSFDDLMTDVDRAVPRTGRRNPNALALVVGIRTYDGGQPEVIWAENDALAVRRYLEQAFGVPAKNIIPTDPGRKVTAGTLKSFVRQLRSRALKGSDVYVYFSGHGEPVPEPGTRLPLFRRYLVTSDTDPRLVDDYTAYNLDQFYRDLDSVACRSLTVILEACFSSSYASAMFPAVANPLCVREQAAVISATDGSELSSWSDEAQHGLMTYFLLKGISTGEADADSGGSVTFREMEQYLRVKVSYWARELYGRSQTPSVCSPDPERVFVWLR
ncbi:MAG: caspase family protein [Bacteroidota bacterium]